MNTQKPPLERYIVKKSLERLRTRGGFWIKVHGSPFQIAGIPDIIGCYKGRFIAIEAKRDAAGKPTLLQAYVMKKIRAAGGVTALIFTADMAEAILDRLDELREARVRKHNSPPS